MYSWFRIVCRPDFKSQDVGVFFYSCTIYKRVFQKVYYYSTAFSVFMNILCVGILKHLWRITKCITSPPKLFQFCSVLLSNMGRVDLTIPSHSVRRSLCDDHGRLAISCFSTTLLTKLSIFGERFKVQPSFFRPTKNGHQRVIEGIFN